jgi:hypothetical protein
MLKVKVIILTILLWLVVCALYCYWYISSILARPITDTYANSVGFQFVMFMLLRFPFLFAALLLAIYFELILFANYKEKN